MIISLIQECQARGVALTLEDGQVKIKAPKGAMTQSLLAQIREQKVQLKSLLTAASEDLESSTLTPSDFPLAELSVDALASIEDKFQSIADIYVATPTQEGMLFHSLLEDSGAMYTSQLSFTLTGEVDSHAFVEAWQHTLEQFDILRTGFAELSDSQVHQVVVETATLPCVHMNWCEQTQSQQQEQLVKYLLDDKKVGFDFECPPLMRLTMIQLTEDKVQVVWSHHHMLLDGWCLPVVFNHVLERYQALINQTSLGSREVQQYSNYISWLKQQDETQAKAYWLDRVESLESSTVFPRTQDNRMDNPGLANFSLSQKQTSGLQQLAKKYKCSLNVLLQAAWGYLLTRYTNQQKIVFGTVISGRPAELSGVESMMGLFINTIPVTLEDNHQGLEKIIQDLSVQHSEAEQHGYYPLAKIQTLASVDTLFDSLFVFENYPLDQNILENYKDIPFTIADIKSHENSNYALTLQVQLDSQLHLQLHVKEAVLSEQQMQRILPHLGTILNAMVDNPDSNLSDLDMLSLDEKNYLLTLVNDSQKDFPDESLVQQMISRHAETHPNNIALVFEDRQLTYQQLEERTNQLAYYLLEQGVGSESLVGVALPRSLEMIVAMVAILKAGGAYVPLDPCYPQARLDYMLDNSGIKTLLTDSTLITKFDRKNLNALAVDVIAHELNDYDKQQLSCNDLHSNNLAYVIYTSGSTGQPKGVQVEHRGAINLALHTKNAINISHNSRVMHFASLSFDAATWEMLMSLCNGAELHICSERERESTILLADFLLSHKITHGFIPPTLLAYIELHDDYALEAIMVGGEACDKEQAWRWAEYYPVFNAYGPAESTVVTHMGRVTPAQKITIGSPIDNTRAYVLDFYQRLVPQGVVGELCVAGTGLSRGYLGKPELTAERFIEIDVAGKAEHLYRTGDLVRMTTSGEVEFVGRNDEQISLRGFRIELGEIEHQLSALNAVESCLVLVKEEDGHKQLTAYFVSATPNVTDIGQVKAELCKCLPKHMVPNMFSVVKKWPLTANGKIDKNALFALGSFNTKQNRISCSNETEQKLLTLWTELLQLPAAKVGVTDDFIELGGHSLLAIRLAVMVRETFETDISIRDIFDFPTIAQLAAKIEATDQSQHDTRVTAQERTEKLPLSFAQQRLWFIDRLQGGSIQYNMPAAFKVQGDFNSHCAQQALQQIVNRHEILRTIYQSHGEDVSQVILPSAVFELPIISLIDLNEQEQHDKIESLIHEHANAAFDLSVDLPIRATWIEVNNRLGQAQGILLFNMHHIASDGWSMDVLIKEFKACYLSLVTSREVSLPALDVQYADFALWQRQYLQGDVLQTQLDYWQTQLRHAPISHSLPFDFPRQAVNSHQGGSVNASLSPFVSHQLKALAHQRGVTPFMLIHAVLSLVLLRNSNRTDIVVGTGVANRLRQELQPLIGFFVNALALRTNIQHCHSFADYLAHVKQVNLGAQSNQDVPFEQLVEHLKVPRNLHHNPVFQVMLSLNANIADALQFDSLKMQAIPSQSLHAKFDLMLDVSLDNDQIDISWTYDKGLFKAATIERINQHFETLLTSALDNPDGALSALKMLTNQDSNQLLALGESRKTYVLDRQLALCPEGVIGEIYQGNADLENPSDDSCTLVTNPFNASEKLRRTGELARWEQGQLIVMGKVDDQFNLDGQECDLSELASELEQLTGVASAVIKVHKDSRLVACIKPSNTCPTDEKTQFALDLRQQLRDKVPSNLLPSIFVFLQQHLESGPWTLPTDAIYLDVFVAPATESEIALSKIWQTLLGLEKVSLDDDFFQVGGHSLMAVRLVSEIRSQFNVELDVRDIFENVTISSLAKRIDSGSLLIQRPRINAFASKSATALSFAQQRLWFIDQLQPHSSVYNMPVTLNVHGKLDIEMAKIALNRIIARHHILRTVYRAEVGEAQQYVKDKFDLSLPTIDLSHLGQDKQNEHISAELKKDNCTPFDLSSDLMLRVKWLHLSSQTGLENGVLILNMHHIASDGWSMGVLVNEFAQQYEALCAKQSDPLPPLSIQYSDFAQWQRDYLQGDVLNGHVDYWTQQLDSIPVVHNIPLDFARPLHPVHQGGQVSTELGLEVSNKLQALAQQQGVTPFMLLHAAFSGLLFRHSNSEDIVIGTPMANRLQSELDPLIGFFVNTLVLRTKVSGQQSFVHYLEQVKQVNLDAQSHQEIPFEQLVELSNVHRATQHAPLFQIMFMMDTNEERNFEFDGVTFTPRQQEDIVARFDLDVSAQFGPQGVAFNWVYDTALFTHQHIEQMANDLNRLLTGIANAPATTLDELPMLSEAHCHYLTNTLNQTSQTFDQYALIHELFEQQVTLKPSHIALVFEDTQLSYDELNQASNRLAHYLIAHGVTTETLVGVCIERSSDMIISVLGILKAGAAYVPMDPNYPKARLDYILQDTGLSHLISNEDFARKLYGPENLLVIDFDADAVQQSLRQCSTLNPTKQVICSAYNLAYIIYTSGSTGHPKGVMIEHQSLVNSTLARRSVYPDMSSFLLLSPVAFDSSVAGIFHTLTTGAKLCIGRDIFLNNAQELVGQMHKNKVSHLLTTPSLYQVMIDVVGETELSELQSVIIAGESFSSDLVIKHHRSSLGKNGAVSLYNEYGPTEATVWSTVCQLQPDQEISIGRPIQNAKLYVVSSTGVLLPHGSIGELYIGGAGVARGYLNNTPLTNEKFIQNSYSNDPQERLYKTGDLVRYQTNGHLEFMGRIDDQVKIRGYRIELGEVEANLAKCQGLGSCSVQVRDDVDGQKRIVAYVVPSADCDEDNKAFIEQIRLQLQLSLPDHMVPGAFVIMDTLPLTSNGKIDKQALLSYEYSLSDREYVVPNTDTEKVLVNIWSELLKLDVASISAEADFFELGGHSLHAVRLVAEIQNLLKRDITIKAVFETPTVRTLAKKVDQMSQSGQERKIESITRQQGEKLKTSFAQQRLWLVDQLHGGSSAYNMPSAVRVLGEFNTDIAQKCISRIVQRHEALRTVFVADGEDTAQIVLEHFNFELITHDLTELNSEDQQEAVEERLRADCFKAFDLSRDLMLRASYIKLNDSENPYGVLLFNTHHIASDGWSKGILLSEFVTQYDAISKALPDPLSKLEIQYADYSHWQRNWLTGEILHTQLGYWENQLADVPAVHNLALDHPRPEKQEHKGALISHHLPVEFAENLQCLAAQHRLTPFMLVHAGLAIVLSRHSNSNDIVIGIPSANRMQVELKPLIGFFVNNLVLRTNSSNCLNVTEFLEHVKQVNLDAQSHQDIAFDQLLEHLHIIRSKQHTPLFQIMLSMDNNEEQSLSLDGLSFEALHSDIVQAKFDLTLNARVDETGVHLNWIYDTALFNASTIERLNEHFANVLQAMVAHPEGKLADIPMLSDSETHQLLHELNGVKLTFPEDKLIHEFFEKQAAEYPNNTAIVFEERQVSYRELNQSANQLAHDLRGQGVGVNSLVGVYAKRSVEMVVSIIAILKAGGAYVPLDTDSPIARLEKIIEDTQLKHLLMTSKLVDKLSLESDVKLCVLDSLGYQQHLHGLPIINPAKLARQQPTDLAYVIYTSGSTGQPKGVMVEHKALVNRIDWMQNEYKLHSADRVLQKTPYHFDTAVEEFFWTLGEGACVIVAKPNGHKDPVYLSNLIAREDVTVVRFVPSMLSIYLATHGAEFSSTVRYIFCGGEAMDIDIARKINTEIPHAALHNLYGQTETVIDVSYFDCSTLTDHRRVPIGKPIQNTSLFVLDKSLNLCPYGVAGELHVGGVGLSRGYLNQPELTKERFIDNPFSEDPNARLYRTGDLVHFDAQGDLIYLGRTDDQVKIRGLRIELGEIEYQLSRCDGVKRAVVIAHEDSPGEKRLIAYVLSDFANTSDEHQLIAHMRNSVRAQLPDYMMPSVFVVLDVFPQKTNGKIDKQSLPPPQMAFNQADYIAPGNATEQKLVFIWASLLEIPSDSLSVRANFFDVGGHSLMLVRMASHIKKEFEMSLTLDSLYAEPTIESVASAIDLIVSQQQLQNILDSENVDQDQQLEEVRW